MSRVVQVPAINVVTPRSDEYHHAPQSADSFESFKHEPLRHPERQICPLRIRRSTDIISIKLWTEDFDKVWSEAKYVAISYTWGSAESCRPIKVNGKTMLVRENCYTLMYNGRAFRAQSVSMLYLQLQHEIGVGWIPFYRSESPEEFQKFQEFQDLVEAVGKSAMFSILNTRWACNLHPLRSKWNHARLLKQDHLEILRKFGTFGCSDPRDRIYAMLRLIDWPNDIDPLKADYTQSAVDLAWQLFKCSAIGGHARRSLPDLRRSAMLLSEALQVPLDNFLVGIEE